MSYAIDVDTDTLFSKAGGAGNTITSGTATSAMQMDYMTKFYVDFKVASGAFSTTCFAVLQSSIDGTTFVDITDSTTTISAAGNYAWNYADPAFNYFRVNFTVTANCNFLGVTSTCRTVGVK